MMISVSRTKHLIGMLIAAALILGAFALTGMACSCAPSPEPLIARDQADAVFAGRVLALELVTRFDADPTVSFTTEDLMVTIVAHSRWKGEIAEQITLYTAFTCCICGYPFQIGEEYLIYARADEDGLLRTSICSRTALLDDSSADLGVLGNLKPASLIPEPDPSQEEPSP